ncbi:MAG: hypothetical protein SFY56_00885 [Bacteroidota bacterium]|nr:hypothetical protein [Bacteroidota bacterium]
MNKKVIVATLFTLVLLKVLVVSLSNKKIRDEREDKISKRKQEALEDIKKGNFFILTHGFPDFAFLIYQKPFVDKFGFKYKDMGCSGDFEGMDSIYNYQVVEYLTSRNGKNWYQKFLNSKDSIYEIYLKLDNDSLKKSFTEKDIESIY